MSKTLTITVKDIPDDLWKDFWEFAIKSTTKDLGVPIVETNHIEIDAKSFLLYPEEYAEFMGSALSAHVIATADEIPNPFR